MELAVIGREDFILGFKLAGVEKTYMFSDESEIEKLLSDTMREQNVGIVVIEKKYLDEISQQLRYDALSSVKPILITLSSDGTGVDIGKRIKQVIGIDLYGGDS